MFKTCKLHILSTVSVNNIDVADVVFGPVELSFFHQQQVSKIDLDHLNC